MTDPENRQNDTLDEDDSEKSKTRVKKEMQALQELGEQLVALSKPQLEKIALDDTLLDAILTAQRIKKREGKRRQLQYIGKLMRKADHETIERHLQLTQSGSEEARKQLHHLENWRDRLLAEGEAVMQELLDEFPDIDRQHIRQLMRQARKELDEGKPPAASRKIFRYLKQHHEND